MKVTLYHSVKWVGLFVTALVGLYTIEDLWDKFGDLKMTVVRSHESCSSSSHPHMCFQRDQCRHWAARIACLIVLPILVYMTCFKIHFLILSHSGPGDAQMSSLFQANLEGNDFGLSPLGKCPSTRRAYIELTTTSEIAYGSKVTLKNFGYGGGLLHSHVQTYPVGSNQQQVTCYHYKDENNEWTILPRWEEPPYDNQGPIRFLQDTDVIRLNHVPTTRNLTRTLSPRRSRNSTTRSRATETPQSEMGTTTGSSRSWTTSSRAQGIT